jgi:serine/threonine-protein phosphatase 4 regulatory subunit 1
MATDRDYRVRNSIASSLYEIGKIIGPELTEAELIPVFDRLSREEGDMQNTLLRILPNFLKDLSKATRRSYLEKLKRFLNPKEKWRIRMEFSSIIGEYDSVFDDEITYKQIFPISLYFCVDDVIMIILFKLGRRSQIHSCKTLLKNYHTIVIKRIEIQIKMS